MIIGTVREIKAEEYRAGLTPEGAHALVDAGHRVLVETQTGAGVGHSDEAYAACGATIVENAWEVWARASPCSIRGSTSCGTSSSSGRAAPPA